MNAQRPDLEKMCREHFNEPLICGLELGRCIGYGEDAMDAYLIIRRANGEVYWNSCVGGYFFLDRLAEQNEIVSNNGEETWDDLYRISSALEFCGCIKEKEFIVDIRPEEDPYA